RSAFCDRTAKVDENIRFRFDRQETLVRHCVFECHLFLETKLADERFDLAHIARVARSSNDEEARMGTQPGRPPKRPHDRLEALRSRKMAKCHKETVSAGACCVLAPLGK